MADIRINALPALGAVAAEDILHILDASTTNDVDKQTTVDAVADWIIANKNVRISGISDVPGLQAALDLKSNVGHTHTVGQVIGLQGDLNDKLDVNAAQIIGRNIIIGANSINVPSALGGAQDDRIPSSVTIGDYLQFGATDGGIDALSGATLKGNLALNLVDNTTDASKPVSGPQQTALDTKVDTSVYNIHVNGQNVFNTALSDGITTNITAIALNTSKTSFDSASSTKLDGIESGADVTDTGNVWSSLGISGSGSTGQFLTQRGVFVDEPSVSINKSQIDAAIGASPTGNATLFYDQQGNFTAPEGGDEVTKQAIDNAIGVFPTGDSAQFYNEQGNFVDAVYDSIEDAPIIRNRTVERIVLSGTRSNVQARLTGVSELSIITIQNDFDSSPTQYTTTFTSPNTTLSPVISLPAGSQGRQLSLTEADGTLHRFCYLVNGNYRLLDGGLTGTVRLGPVAVATTATVTAAVTVPDQTAGQTITLVGDETGTFSVGDFISPQANNFGAYRGIFVDSITFDGTNTVIVGPSNGATTFNTTSVLRNAGPATEVQGTIPTFSGDPDTANTVYSSSIPATEFTTAGVNTSAHLIQVANAYAALETAITTDGIVTDNGDGTSSITINYNTETNIDSSFTITGGLNNIESIVNVDGMIGDLSPATTITVTDPEATEVVSFTSSAADTSTSNVDDIAAQIVTAVNDNTETPINFDAEYDAATKTIILTAESAGNTNPWTIIFNNNGVTNENAGNLGYTSSQSGEIINQIETISVVGNLNTDNIISDGHRFLDLSAPTTPSGIIPVLTIDTAVTQIYGSAGVAIDISSSNSGMRASQTITDFNFNKVDRDFIVYGTGTTPAVSYDAGDNTWAFDPASTYTGLPAGGGDGLSITDTVNLNLLDGTTVLSTVTLPSSSGTTVIAGTTNEIVNTVSGDTNTLSLAPAITDAITANTAKTGITTTQSAAISTNTGKTGITVAQSNAIIANTAKTGISTAQATAITNNTAKVGITTAQATAITNNTAKVGITTAQASAITANTAKNSYPTADATKLGTIETNADVTDTANVVGSLTAGTNITIATDGTISAASGGTSTTVLGTANEVDVNTVGNTATVSLNTAITSAITANTAKQSVSGLTQVGGAIIASDSVLYYDGTVPRRKVFSSVPLSIFNNDAGFTTNSGTVTSVSGTANQVDVATGTTTPVVSLNSTITSAITANTSKTGITTAQANAITANTAKTGISTAQSTAITNNTAKVGITTAQATAITNNTAKTGITTAQSDAITANTAKVSVAGLNQVGAAVLSTDSVVYYAGTALAPRRKTFSSVPLSVFNNDAGFITSGVSLADDNDWTGIQTFSNAAGIQVENIVGASEMHISANGNEIITYDDSLGIEALLIDANHTVLRGNTSTSVYVGTDLSSDVFIAGTTLTTFNSGLGDRNFVIRKQTSGDALRFDAGTDTLSTEAANLEGFAGSETGTWTPTIQNAGTTSNVVARYTKSGSNVIAHVQADTTGGNAFIGLSIVLSSLPFALDSTLRVALGTYFTSATSNSLAASTSGVLVIDSVNINFLDNANNTYLRGNDTRGFIGLTITYETTD